MEIEEELEYDVESKHMTFNSDRVRSTLTIECTSLTRGQRSTLVWLISNGPVLHFSLRELGEDDNDNDDNDNDND